MIKFSETNCKSTKFVHAGFGYGNWELRDIKEMGDKESGRVGDGVRICNFKKYLTSGILISRISQRPLSWLMLTS